MEKELRVLEEVFAGALKGTSRSQNFFVALHNSFVHGKNLELAGYKFTDKQLKDMFVHFDALNDIAKGIDEETGV